ncbi:putative ankyrin repeat protein RF_0381 [Coccinella septempunctata]|uniref:putative ankyrin repeat protein RF_0381 n=1 Tax=Coccinella septempunctata TaxID=41139 RepID=UPI001D08DF28|nr:putative ankyrin repeat protein RF_0381 [Coccinella septempunctata]
MANLLLHLGANIKKPLMFSGKTPLLVAVSHGYAELTKFLVNKGAPLDDVDINGLGVMHNAVNSGSGELIRFFVGLGLDVNAKDRNGLTPLHRAVILELDENIVNFLIESGADPNAKDENGFDFKIHKCLNEKKVICAFPTPKFIFSQVRM